MDGESRQAKCNGGLPLVGGLEPEAAPDYFRVLSADASARGLPDLATSEGQRIFGVRKKQRDHTMNEIKNTPILLHKRYDASSAFTPRI